MEEVNNLLPDDLLIETDATEDKIPQEISLTYEEKLELTSWLIERYDGLEAAGANRSAIILSANALLLTASTFLLDLILARGQNLTSIPQAVVTLGVVVTMVLLGISIVYSVIGIVNVWKTNREIIGKNKLPQSLFFNSRDTTDYFDEYEAFESVFETLTQNQTLRFGMSELWASQKTYSRRYETRKKAIKFFLFALLSFFLTVIILLVV